MQKLPVPLDFADDSKVARGQRNSLDMRATAHQLSRTSNAEQASSAFQLSPYRIRIESEWNWYRKNTYYDVAIAVRFQFIPFLWLIINYCTALRCSVEMESKEGRNKEFDENVQHTNHFP